MFGEISPRYDFLNHFLSGGTDYYWRWRTVRSAAPQGEQPVLDVCTGTGDLAVAYWRRGRGRVRVVGADFTHEMLTLARQKTASLDFRFAGDRLRRSRCAAAPFCRRSISNRLGRLRTAKRDRYARRACGKWPASALRAAAWSCSNSRCRKSRVIGGLYRWYFRHVLPRIGQLVSGNRQSAYRYLPDSVSEFPCGERLAAMMKSCGLDPVTWTPLTFGIATLYVGTKSVRQ